MSTSQRSEGTEEIIRARHKLDRARKAERAAAAALDRVVALAVSSEPTSRAWYLAPGQVPRNDVMEAAGLTTMQLHRLMERYRTANPPKPRRRTRRAS